MNSSSAIRPDLTLRVVCSVCDAGATSVDRTIQWERGGDLVCVNVVAHVEELGAADDQVLIENVTARVHRTDGDSRRYHTRRHCPLLRAGQRSRTQPAPVFETNRLEALRSGRTACHGCCPTSWDSKELDAVVNTADTW